MTRKQALEAAIELLSSRRECTEIVEKLEECAAELPFAGWSEEAIFDACDQFIYEHNRLPNTRDFAGKGLPSHTVIKHRFGVNVSEFRKKYYGDLHTRGSSVFGDRAPDEWAALFVEEYTRLKPASAADYNRLRPKHIPSWTTIAKMLGAKSWVELRNSLNLPPYKKTRSEAPGRFSVRCSSPSMEGLRSLGKGGAESGQ